MIINLFLHREYTRTLTCEILPQALEGMALHVAAWTRVPYLCSGGVSQVEIMIT